MTKLTVYIVTLLMPMMVMRVKHLSASVCLFEHLCVCLQHNFESQSLQTWYRECPLDICYKYYGFRSKGHGYRVTKFNNMLKVIEWLA